MDDWIECHGMRGIAPAALVVWRQKPVLVGTPAIAMMISDFIDPAPLWTIEAAIDKGFARLAARIVAHRCDSSIDYHYVEALCDARVDIAAISGDLATVASFASFAECFPTLVMTNAAQRAAAGGHMDILLWLHERGGLVVWGQAPYRAACQAGHIAVLEWLNVTNPAILDANLLMIAIEQATIMENDNNDNVVRWIWAVSSQMGWPANILHQAVSCAPLRLATWMWQTRTIPLALTLDVVASRGDLAFLKWANDRGAIATTRAMDNAARNGRLKVVQWLHENREDGCTTEAMDSAAGNGHFLVLEWLRVNRRDGCTSRAFVLAASLGLHVLRWLAHHFPRLLNVDDIRNASIRHGWPPEVVHAAFSVITGM